MAPYSKDIGYLAFLAPQLQVKMTQVCSTCALNRSAVNFEFSRPHVVVYQDDVTSQSTQNYSAILTSRLAQTTFERLVRSSHTLESIQNSLIYAEMRFYDIHIYVEICAPEWRLSTKESYTILFLISLTFISILRLRCSKN